jgi:hypothetical protein
MPVELLSDDWIHALTLSPVQHLANKWTLTHEEAVDAALPGVAMVVPIEAITLSNLRIEESGPPSHLVGSRIASIGCSVTSTFMVSAAVISRLPWAPAASV